MHTPAVYGKMHGVSAKDGRNYKLNSLNKFHLKYRMQVDTPYVIHGGDFVVRDDVTYLPLYMTHLL